MGRRLHLSPGAAAGPSERRMAVNYGKSPGSGGPGLWKAALVVLRLSLHRSFRDLYFFGLNIRKSFVIGS
jgi:hypothetical protein